MNDVKAAIRARAAEFGFDAVGVTSAEGGRQDAANLARYLAEGRHGDMHWMERTAERRADPQALWPEVRSIICLGVNYGPAEEILGRSIANPTGAPSASTPAAATTTTCSRSG